MNILLNSLLAFQAVNISLRNLHNKEMTPFLDEVISMI